MSSGKVSTTQDLAKNRISEGIQRTVEGTVISNKMDKTSVIKVERKVMHPLYKKYIKRSTKLHVHDEKNECQMGDTVQAQECRPLSKQKNWKLVKIISRAD